MPEYQNLQKEERARLRALGRSPDDFGSIYRVQVNQELRKEQIESHYRFTELSINGTIGLIPLTLIFPLYAIRVAGVDPWWWSVFIALGMASFTGFMLHTSAHNIVDWEQVRSELVFGTITPKGSASKESSQN